MKAYILQGNEVVITSDLATIRAAVERETNLWVDLEREQTPDEFFTIFGVHLLTVEDIWAEAGAPKLEEFDNYLYIRFHGVNSQGDELVRAELDIVLGQHFVITHDSLSFCSTPLRAEPSRAARLLAKGPAWVAHGLLDNLVDLYTPVVEHFEEELETLERDILESGDSREVQEVLQKVFGLKQKFQVFRRIAVHQREVLNRLARGEFTLITGDLIPFFRDIYDHFVRTMDHVESCRELVSNALDIHLSVQSNRMNEVMKTLALASTIMLPLTFIAGVYGMNFEFMPELKWRYGYLFALIFMLVVCLAIVAWFKRKRWL